MTAGIPHDMRRIALVSLAAHVVALMALTTVPLTKISSRGASAIEVLLVSQPSAPVQVERAPVPQPKPTPPSPPAPQKTAPPPPAQPKAAPPPPTVAKATPVPQAALLQKRLQEITVPKEVTPALPTEKHATAVPKAPQVAQADPAPSVPVLKEYQRPTAPTTPQPARVKPVAPPTQTEPVSPKAVLPRNLAESLKRARESLAKQTPVPPGKPVAPAAAPEPKLPTSEEISRLLKSLPAPTAPKDVKDAPTAQVPPALPVEKPAPKNEPPLAAALPSPAPAAAPQRASLERCPPKARSYCPKLEAAINRVWNADTNPAVRQVLESAGDSTAMMRIVIQPNGEIGDIILYKSSGNDAYDRAVESVLRELQRVPPLPDEMKGESFVAVTSFTYTKQ